MVTVDGLTLAAPTALRLGYESVGRTELTADGNTATDRLALKRRAELEWRGLDRAPAQQLLSALTQGVFLSVTLPDPRAGEAVSLTMRLISLDADVMDVDAAGQPGVCRAVTAVLRER